MFKQNRAHKVSAQNTVFIMVSGLFDPKKRLSRKNPVRHLPTSDGEGVIYCKICLFWIPVP